MATASTYRHIDIDERGTPRIGKTRYQVLHLAVEHYHYGWSAEELLRQHADLRPEEVYAALTYFYDHYDSMLGEMKEFNERGAVRLRNQALTREELLRRSSQAKG